jgi:CRISPR-associated protein Cas4
MDNFLQISKINDFLYSPKSIYFHQVYQDYDIQTYHSEFQTRGNLAHDKIDNGDYSSQKRYLSGMAVASEKYELIGKIDIYDIQEKTLIERKYKIQTIHKGYLYQLYAQMLCLEEMGYEVKKMCLHSLSDNKRYKVKTPAEAELKEFMKLLQQIRNYDLTIESRKWQTTQIDDKTIYNPLYF